MKNRLWPSLLVFSFDSKDKAVNNPTIYVLAVVGLNLNDKNSFKWKWRPPIKPYKNLKKKEDSTNVLL